MAGILDAIRVIEVGQIAAIPSAGAMMADWGAEVIKVEPLSGEMWRARRIGREGVPRVIKFDGGEVNWWLQSANRNKKGLAVDLKTDSGRAILYKLVQRSDVFMSNYQVSSLKGLKLDYATLSQLNPKLVYAVMTAYGTVGPLKDEGGMENESAWARSGMQHLIGEPGSPPPTLRAGMMDRTAATYVLTGILAALLHREKTGKGQELESSLYHTGVWTLSGDIQGALMGFPVPKPGRTQRPDTIGNTYRTKDDRWFFLTQAADWPSFCRAIERPELENDPRFNTREAREQNGEEFVGILDEVFASKNLEDWEKRLRENNFMFRRVQTPAEVITDPQALANDFFAEVHHPYGGVVKVVTSPIKFHQNPASVRTPAPELGQHNEEILLDLGYRRDDIVQLRGEGVIP